MNFNLLKSSGGSVYPYFCNTSKALKSIRLNTLDSTAAPIRHNLDRTLATFPSTNPTLSLYAIDAIAEAVYRPTPVFLMKIRKGFDKGVYQ